LDAPLLLDLSHSGHTRARTGIQRVTRALHSELGAAAVCFDPYEGAWRPLEGWEEENLSAAEPAAGRGARWPVGARLRGALRRLSRRGPLLPTANSGVLVPEIFSPGVAAALPALFAASRGPRVALFHDAIALRLPEMTPRGTVARFPAYLSELLQFDGIAAVSEDSRASLLDYWRWLGVAKSPPVCTIALGVEAAPPGNPAPAQGPEPVVLCVGSIEARKNHLSLLEACEGLWARGLGFRLRLVGMANAETGGPALRRIGELRAAGRPVEFDGARTDAGLEAAYAQCAFTVYPSLAEGFGLPVAESLVRGKPCLCRTAGALGEVALGGGCVGLGDASPAEIASAIALLLASPGELAALRAAALGRTFRSWPEYCLELRAWIGTLQTNA
jgi:glycosyltransferase involved in cell wall biosynthesis